MTATPKDIELTNVDSRLESAKKKIIDKRVQLFQRKSKELAKHYTDRFNEYLNAYFSGYIDSKDENKITYDGLNAAWKKYANESNRTQKYISVKPQAFEEEVNRIVSENIKYQEFHPYEIKKELIDLTNLKSE